MWDLATVKSGDKTVVGSVVELSVLFAVASLPPETEAELVMLFVPSAVPNPTLILKLKTLEPLAAMTVELVQVMTCGDAAFELQVQLAAFVPLKVTLPTAPPLTVKPVGKVSVKVIVPLVEAVPELPMVNE